MDADTLSRELENRGLSRQTEAAKALRVSQGTVSRWLAGETPIPAWVAVALQAVKHRAAKARAKGEA